MSQDQIPIAGADVRPNVSDSDSPPAGEVVVNECYTCGAPLARGEGADGRCWACVDQSNADQVYGLLVACVAIRRTVRWLRAAQ